MTTLADLRAGQKGKVIGLDMSRQEDLASAKRLLEMGFVEGAICTLTHLAPLSKDPIAVEVRGTQVGLRKKEASIVMVEVLVHG